MGVPALFRWLSRKYPKIVRPVKEDTPSKVLDADGKIVEVPVKYEGPNPNGFEVDNLYLDMNGIVHPCTHPENGVAPETEEDMMVAVFRYTERVVNMARPRKVLMMAIDGVAPRAKMNQQRSRRFRAAQEAHDKEIERQENIKAFEALGKPVSDEFKNQKPWDSNAITPGTPFMDLLAASLKYWVSYKLTNDPGWKDLKVIISDSSVPGEGEHKIVDWIRRQRSHPEWDPNTSHVIYGLDADLIMLALATHEPNFRVLREDVFMQSSNSRACKNCGKEGHIAANCRGKKKVENPEEKEQAKVVDKAKPIDPKPFIFLDVSILREYLAVELRVPNTPFPFDGEIAIDDWIFMIFFVGNDFLPHLPSLEIREGAIDMLLKIWKAELARMGGYLTYHGKVNLERAGIILEGLAKNEDEIFQRRKETEDRQEANTKRRRMEDHAKQDREAAAEAARHMKPGLNGQEYTAVTPAETARGGALHPSLPARPATVMVSPPAKKLTPAEREEQSRQLSLTLAADNADLIKNRKAIRMANLDAAALLKAELEGDTAKEEEGKVADAPDAPAAEEEQGEENGNDEEVEDSTLNVDGKDGEAEGDRPGDEADEDMAPEESGRKRKREDDDEDEEDSGSDVEAPPNPEADQPITKKKLKINPDGTVDGYVDDVRMWEPGYMERYYRSKFGVELSDREFINKITYHYMEGLCWVLEYYYNGVPAWDWYYPYHYAPFAQDFRNVERMEIEFAPARPFKPFGQLLGVFPAASRKHLPLPLQSLMIDEDSPIIDFYPEDFEIDMNGKKMAWQGVALLPFIDQDRLLSALASKEDELTEDEKRRNRWGDSVMYISDGSQLYDPFCGLYTLNAATQPVPIDPRLSQGTNGQVLADANCVPNSAFESPLPTIEACPDIDNNNSMSVRYFFPRQLHSHRSEVLRGYTPGPPALTESDKDWTRRGGGVDHGGRRGGGGGGGPRGGGGGVPIGAGPGFSRNGGGPPPRGPPPPRNGGGGMRDHYQPPPPPPRGGGGGGYQPYGAPPPPVRAGGYGGPPSSSYSPYGQMPPSLGGYAPPAPSYGGSGGGYGAQNGGGYGGSGGYGNGQSNGFNQRGPAPSAAYGGYPPPSNVSRNPYGPPPTNSNPYGAPPPQNGYGGGGNRGGYNPYGGGNQRY